MSFLADKAQLYQVEIVAFGIKRIALPDEVTKKVFERMTKERQRISEQWRSRGQSEARQIVAEAQKKRDKILADAKAEAKMIVARGEVEAARYLPVFAQNPELHDFLIKLDTMLQIAQDPAREEDKPVYILDYSTPPYDLLRTGPDVPKVLQAPEIKDLSGKKTVSKNTPGK